MSGALPYSCLTGPASPLQDTKIQLMILAIPDCTWERSHDDVALANTQEITAVAVSG